jgi:RNA polymerase sigma-70 factor (ECF subfamily)
MTPESHAGLHDVLKGLDALPEEQRSILLLVGVEDLSYEQAAQVLDIPLGTVMSRLSRARARLREFMENGRSAVLRRVK